MEDVVFCLLGFLDIHKRQQKLIQFYYSAPLAIIILMIDD